jgi:hypothetical protein
LQRVGRRDDLIALGHPPFPVLCGDLVLGLADDPHGHLVHESVGLGVHIEQMAEAEPELPQLGEALVTELRTAPSADSPVHDRATLPTSGRVCRAPHMSSPMHRSKADAQEQKRIPRGLGWGRGSCATFRAAGAAGLRLNPDVGAMLRRPAIATRSTICGSAHATRARPAGRTRPSLCNEGLKAPDRRAEGWLRSYLSQQRQGEDHDRVDTLSAVKVGPHDSRRNAWCSVVHVVEPESMGVSMQSTSGGEGLVGQDRHRDFHSA